MLQQMKLDLISMYNDPAFMIQVMDIVKPFVKDGSLRTRASYSLNHSSLGHIPDSELNLFQASYRYAVNAGYVDDWYGNLVFFTDYSYMSILVLLTIVYFVHKGGMVNIFPEWRTDDWHRLVVGKFILRQVKEFLTGFDDLIYTETAIEGDTVNVYICIYTGDL